MNDEDSDLARILKRITYKEGWTFEVHSDNNHDRVEIHMRTKDANDPNEDLLVSKSFALDRRYELTERAYLIMIKSKIRDIELSELDQWYRVDDARAVEKL